MFAALGIPREPVDDRVVAGIPWNSDDMVAFEAAVREGRFEIISDDLERLTGRRPRSLRSLFEENAETLWVVAAAREKAVRPARSYTFEILPGASRVVSLPCKSRSSALTVERP